MPGLWFAFAYLVCALILHPKRLPQWRDLPEYAGAWLGFVLGAAAYEWLRDVQRKRDSTKD